MRSYFLFFILLLAAFPAAAQTKKPKAAKKPAVEVVPTPVPPGFVKTPSGLVYQLFKYNDTARQANAGDVATIHIELLTMGDTVFISTRTPTVHPLQVKINRPQYKGCMNEGLAMMRIGDSAVFIANADSLYNKTLKNPNMPPVISPGSFVKIKVKMLDVKSELELFQEKEALKKKYSEKESFAIEEYLTSHNYNAIQSQSGLRFISGRKTDGIKPQPGDTVVVHYTGRLLNDSIFDSSVQRGEPITFPVGQNFVIEGWEETLMGMHKGESCTVVIPFAMAYGEQGRPPKIPPYSALVFDIELLDVKAKPHAQAYDISGKEMKTTNSGLQYIIVSKGSGDQAYYNHPVKVHYTGYLTDGTIFDSSVERGEPFSFMLGAKQVIPGWEEGIRLMQVGDKFRFILPAKLAYGERAMGNIPANSTLIFDVELLQVD